MARPTLIVFLRLPAVGRGKSRLARDIGRVEAWRLARAMAAGTLRRLRDPRWKLVVRVTPDRGGERASLAPGSPGRRVGSPRVEPQGPGDLGRRLTAAIRAHARGPVAVVGTDAPGVSAAHVGRAFAATRRSGAAIGPAEDGGFWILALSARRARRLALGGVRWSSPHALADTVAAIGGPVVRLETLVDVDDLSSLRSARVRRR